MANRDGLQGWIPLLTKLVWPFFVIVSLLIFHKQAGEIYDVIITGVKSGRSMEIGGFIKLGEAATRTEIGSLAQRDLSIEGIGGPAGVVRKGTARMLTQLQQQLRDDPLKTINTLLVPDRTTYSVALLKEYIGTLGLRYVVLQRRGKFDGWIAASTFVAQLPADSAKVTYGVLKRKIVGIHEETVRPEDSARDVLGKMQALHLDSLPVVDSDHRWIFFVNRGEILARLMTTIILEKA